MGKEKSKEFQAHLRQRGVITVPPETREALNVKEGDLLNVTLTVERRRNNNNEKTKE